jgi:hypothetical protein
MPNDTREGRADAAPILLAWGMPLEAAEGTFEELTVWLTGGVSLLLWTALALLLTS